MGVSVVDRGDSCCRWARLIALHESMINVRILSLQWSALAGLLPISTANTVEIVKMLFAWKLKMRTFIFTWLSMVRLYGGAYFVIVLNSWMIDPFFLYHTLFCSICTIFSVWPTLITFQDSHGRPLLKGFRYSAVGRFTFLLEESSCLFLFGVAMFVLCFPYQPMVIIKSMVWIISFDRPNARIPTPA